MTRCAVQTRLPHHRGKERVDPRRGSQTPSTRARWWVSAAVMQTDNVLSSFNLNDSYSRRTLSIRRTVRLQYGDDGISIGDLRVVQRGVPTKVARVDLSAASDQFLCHSGTIH
jgi:hypothetical protein